jgi:ethanolamine utilization protein EutN
VKHPSLTGYKLLVCRPIDAATGKLRSGRVVGLDTVQAGIGDTVLVIDEGNAARRILGSSRAPVRTVIAAIVDEVNTGQAGAARASKGITK